MKARDLQAIKTAKEAWKFHNSPDSDENVLKDMLSDMLHLADELGVHLDMDSAHSNYAAEAGICDNCRLTPQEVLAEDDGECWDDKPHRFTPDDIEMDRRGNE